MNCKNTIFLLIISIIVSCLNLSASPAYPGLIGFVQPDGTKINIYLKGDERVKWAETEDGYSLLFSAGGTYEYAILDGQGDMVPSGKTARNLADRTIEDATFLNNVPKHLSFSIGQWGMARQISNIKLKDGLMLKSFPTTGSRKLLCILIGFSDKAFSKSKAQFENLFNQVGYSVKGAVGSVHDFYMESSYGQLNLAVTVAGPFTAAHNLAYYGANSSGGNDTHAGELVTEAVNLADPEVDFTQFVNNTPGEVGGVYVIYAGYGEEAGGSADYIWAHTDPISVATSDGPTVTRYSCSPELSGKAGSDLTNIGVICHEFGHILGAHDFYDTNNGTDGQYDGTGKWDLMAIGMWNNSGITPAQPSAYNKCMVYNWATVSDITNSAPSLVTVNNSSKQKEGSFYRINTSTTNEYFLLENRQQQGFDASIPGHGLLVYHVDQNYILAHSGSINTGSHQGMYIMSAKSSNGNGIALSSTSTINTPGCTFSAANGKTSFADTSTPNSLSWLGVNTAKPLTNITENNLNKTVALNFMGGTTCSPPSVQATNFQATGTTNNGMKISWIRGNGNNVMVVARALEPVNNEPFNGTYYTPNTVYGTGSAELGTGNYVVYNGSGTSVMVTGLKSGITYYYSVYEYNSTGYCYKSPALTGSVLTQGTAIPGSSGDMEYDSKITNVVFNTINQVSIGAKTAGYSDYTAIKTHVVKGTAYDLSVKLYTDGPYTYNAYAWIDWNNNSLFEDAEVYNLGTANVPSSTKEGLLTTASPMHITVPDDVINGPIRMRVTCKYIISGAPTPYENNFDGEVEDYTIVVTSAVNWTGNGDTSSDWHNGNNWDPVGVPTEYNHVTIPNLTNDPVISNSAYSYDLTIENGAVLTIGPIGSLTVNGNLTNNTGTTGLILESSSSGTGSLKILGSVTGSATVNRFVNYSHWHLLSPPATESLHGFLTRNLDIPYLTSDLSKDPGADPSTIGLGMTDYGTSSWNHYFTTSTVGDLASGKGYLVRTEPSGSSSPPPTIINFQGALKSGTTNVTLASGWSCIGNPFTSSININHEASSLSGGPNFLSINSTVLTGSYAAVYFWDETKSKTEYQAVNYTSEPTYATVGQGFFVKGSGNVSFTSDIQVHQGTIDYKSVNVPFPEIKLIASGQSCSVSTKIKFIEGTTRGLDVGYDAGLFKSDNNLTLYTKLVEDNGVQFQLQCLPTGQYSSLVIPVGIDSKTGGEVVFSAETTNLPPDCKVILEDRLSNSFTDLSKDAYKTALVPNATVADRFFLHTSELISGLEDKAMPGGGRLSAYAIRNVELRILGQVGEKAVASLYDVSGRLVLVRNLDAGILNRIGLPAVPSGTYLLTVKDNGTTQTIKVILRN